MNCQFTIPLPISASIGEVLIAIQNNGGTFTPTPDGGIFKVSSPLGIVAGSVVLTDGWATITITDKPWLISCSKIEAKLTEFLSSSSPT